MNYSKKKLQKPVFKEGNTAVLGTSGSATYFHWLFDVLPRIHLLRNSFVDFNDIDLFFVDYFNAEFQKETLVQSGIEIKKLPSDLSSFHIKAENLIVPSLPGVTGNMPLWACTFLKDQFLSYPEEAREKRLYVSRGRALHRKILNEKKITDYLETEGFEVIMPERYTVAEQARLFSGAEYVVAPHGAGLANLVFSESGTKVLELFPPDYINVCYWALSNQMSLDYYYAVGRHTATDNGSGSGNYDFNIEIADIK